MFDRFSYEHIDEYQIEVTTYCNAACPQCPRNLSGGTLNPLLPLEHLSLLVLDKAFTPELVSRCRQIFFCGSYGDPIMHPDFLDICQMFRDKNPQVWLYIHTNGSARSTDWWKKLAVIINGYGKIDFGIDGLADTNHLYRKHTNYDKIMENATAFIGAGGKAQWNFIVFAHNEHQVTQAEQLSKQLGFESFLPRKTGRFFNHKTISEFDSWPVLDNSGKQEYQIHPPVDVNYRNNSMLNLEKIKSEYADIAEYFDTTEIKCDALMGNKVVITAQGLVLPCNFFNHNLYDQRFANQNILPGANDLSFVDKRNQIQLIIEQFGADKLNIKHHSIEQIFQNDFWNYVTDSWSKKLSQGKIFECAMTCGKKLTKVWDQGGNNR
jgi:hypothetical protein